MDLKQKIESLMQELTISYSSSMVNTYSISEIKLVAEGKLILPKKFRKRMRFKREIDRKYLVPACCAT